MESLVGNDFTPYNVTNFDWIVLVVARINLTSDQETDWYDCYRHCEETPSLGHACDFFVYEEVGQRF